MYKERDFVAIVFLPLNTTLFLYINMAAIPSAFDTALVKAKNTLTGEGSSGHTTDERRGRNRNKPVST